MRTAYHVLASHYDPLGFIVPYTTRAKVLIQQLWSKRRDWNDPDLPLELQDTWSTWECKLDHLSTISIPCCYLSAPVDDADLEYDLHVFCDTSEWAYGAVAYLAVQKDGAIRTSFKMARSRVTPRRQQSIPRLELYAVLAGAQQAKLVETEMTLTLHQTTLWTDSMTVMEWFQSDSCRFKVFVGTCMSEIQELSSLALRGHPADDITRGKPLLSLVDGVEITKCPACQQWRAQPKVPQQIYRQSTSDSSVRPFIQRHCKG
ncbi:uncharacterized protein LOC122865519 [Siniperca chuatsi]|uniref:uncharacterized protein LOC122865519 n=1 Tax=Siniperca chuatsi TaxID=119488 RepID=UPI001CE02C3F|nr:uncharacterized protein LOC122865519 [Siniperca chuatsi]